MDEFVLGNQVLRYDKSTLTGVEVKASNRHQTLLIFFTFFILFCLPFAFDKQMRSFKKNVIEIFKLGW